MNWWDDNFDEARFRAWLGPHSAPDRKLMRHLIRQIGAKSVIDCGGGLAIEYDGWKFDEGRGYAPIPSYALLDSSKRFTEMANARGIETINASIEKIPLGDNSFDSVYARHVLEHIPSGAATALSEMGRIARKLVLVSFFIPPHAKTATLIDGPVGGLWHNRYSRDEINSLAAHIGQTSWYITTTGTVLSIRKTNGKDRDKDRAS